MQANVKNPLVLMLNNKDDSAMNSNNKNSGLNVNTLFSDLLEISDTMELYHPVWNWRLSWQEERIRKFLRTSRIVIRDERESLVMAEVLYSKHDAIKIKVGDRYSFVLNDQSEFYLGSVCISALRFVMEALNPLSDGFCGIHGWGVAFVQRPNISSDKDMRVRLCIPVWNCTHLVYYGHGFIE